MSKSGLDLACESVQEIYGLDCVVGAALEIPDEFYDFDRKQYRVDKVLKWLTGQCDQRAFRTVGATDVDVYAPGFNFLFGQSTLGGSCCIASSARMTLMDRYSPELALERWHAVVVHELGHALGLQHNENWASVMAFGNSLSELDQQGTTLLRSDWKRLREIHPIRWQGKLDRRTTSEY